MSERKMIRNHSFGIYVDYLQYDNNMSELIVNRIIYI
jgi:hypothetical protein